jgi:hypothetical protein
LRKKLKNIGKNKKHHYCTIGQGAALSVTTTPMILSEKAIIVNIFKRLIFVVFYQII